MDSPDPEISRQLMDRAKKGEAMQNFVNSYFDLLDQEILKRIETDAFTTIKNPNFDMTNVNQLYQFRALCQAVDLIRKRIHLYVQEGKNALTQWKQLNSNQNGEQS